MNDACCANGAERWHEAVERHGATSRDVGVDELVQLYRGVGFLYPEKLERLKPHWDRIMASWQASLTAPDCDRMHRIVAVRDDAGRLSAAISVWLNTARGLHSQHLVSRGRALDSRRVLLACQSGAISTGLASGQNWFRTENRFPARVFGSIGESLRDDQCAMSDHQLVAVPKALAHDWARRSKSAWCAPSAEHVAEVAAQRHGRPWTESEEIVGDDPELQAFDLFCQRSGIRRTRRFFAVAGMESDGIAIAYRGSLGLSFSFLENRCELVIGRDVSIEAAAVVAEALTGAAAAEYEDSPLPWLLVSTDERTASHLVNRGATKLQRYRRSCWLSSGFRGWYEHVDRFYGRVSQSLKRRNGASAGRHE